MPIRIDDRLRQAVRRSPGAVALQVRGAPEEAATTALQVMRQRLQRIADEEPWAEALRRQGIPGISFVSDVSQGPTGPAIWFDAQDCPPELLDWVLTTLVDQLRAADVQDALVTSPPRSRLAASDRRLLEIPNAATLRLFPDPPVVRNGVEGIVPAEWLDLGFDWLRHEVPGLEGLSVMDLLVDGPVDLAGARRFLAHARERSHMQAFVLAGTGDRVQAVIGGFFGVSAALSLTAAGPALGSDALFDSAGGLRELARRLAPDVSLAILSLEAWLGTTMGLYPPATIWQEADGAQPSAVYSLCDELLFDAYPYQILGPGHLRRLGGVPPGGVLLSEGRAEFGAGDLSEWDPRGGGRAAARQRARATLAPCLATPRVAYELRQARWGRQAPDGNGANP